VRVTWVRPEDLIAHELAASRQEGRPVGAIEERWAAAGGSIRPPAGGAGQEPASPALRALAERLLDELDALPAGSGDAEPDDLPGIRALWPTSGGHDAGTGPAVRDRGDSGEGFGQAPAGADRYERVHGAWLGRAIGCLLGKPVEKIPRQGIREILESTGRWPLSGYFTAVGLPEEVAARWPWNRASRATSLAENIDGMPEDDDLNYPLVALHLLETVGPDFGSDDVAAAWLDLLPAGRVFTAERVAYRNMLLGMDPPHTAVHHNPFRQWIGAQIRTDVYGWASPGDPARAAELAWRDARISHVRNGVYGAMYAAALGAAAVVESTVDRVLDAGLAVVPAGSRLAGAVRFAREVAAAEPEWERVVDALYERYGDLHWVHVLPNAALLTAALAHGRGDFVRSICAVVSGGWDTDSSGATVGAVLGGLHGAAALPPPWVEPLHNRLATSLPGFARAGGIGFDELAHRTVAVSS
jgi:ADP-ribosylglycohydrolase